MTKCSDLGLKTLFLTNSWTLLKIAKKWCALCEKDQTCWSGRKLLFCTNSCNLLKIAKTCRTQCENDKPCWPPAESAVLYKIVALSWKPLIRWCSQCKNDKTFCSWAENSDLQKIVHFVAKTCWFRAENVFLPNPSTLLKTANKWCAPCENDKNCWSCAEITILYKLVHFA